METNAIRTFKTGRWLQFLLLFLAWTQLQGGSSERYPETRTRLLSGDDIRGWPDDKLRYAINEMYARRGADFRDKKISQWFAQFDWYHPRRGLSYDDVEADFSEIERANVKLLGEARQSLKNGTPPGPSKLADNGTVEVKRSAKEEPTGTAERGEDRAISAYIAFKYSDKEKDRTGRENLPDAVVTATSHGKKYSIVGPSGLLPYYFKIELTQVGKEDEYQVSVEITDVNTHKPVERFPQHDKTPLPYHDELIYDIPFFPQMEGRLRAFATNLMTRDGERPKGRIEISTAGLRIVHGRVPHFD